MGSMRHDGAFRLAWLAGIPLLAVILGLASCAGWLFAREHAAFDRRRLERMGALSGEQRKLRDGLGAVERRISGLQADLAVQDERRVLAERAAASTCS